MAHRFSDLMDVKEVAEATGRNIETVRRWCRKGRYEAVRIGNMWYLPRCVVRGIMSAVPTAEEAPK